MLNLACAGWRWFFGYWWSASFASPVEVIGTQGKAEVVMELGMPKPDDARDGRYFYLRHGVNIPLRGMPCQLVEGLPLTTELTEEKGLSDYADQGLFEDAEQRQIVWHARLHGDTLTGEWVDGIRG
ncbi:MAG: hypothetical protein FWF31_05870 [Desulfobulbus sp.]|nr:hypothetical protein [Desulfobulbus sp.]